MLNFDDILSDGIVREYFEILFRQWKNRFMEICSNFANLCIYFAWNFPTRRKYSLFNSLLASLIDMQNAQGGTEHSRERLLTLGWAQYRQRGTPFSRSSLTRSRVARLLAVLLLTFSSYSSEAKRLTGFEMHQWTSSSCGRFIVQIKFPCLVFFVRWFRSYSRRPTLRRESVRIVLFCVVALLCRLH